MTLTKVRVDDLDDSIDLGFGKTFKEQITDQGAIATDGTEEVEFHLARTTSGLTKTLLTFGDYNGADLPPTLQYNPSTSKLEFSSTPTTPSTFDSVVLSDDLSSYSVHISDFSETAHGGLVKSIGSLDLAGDPKTAPTTGDFNFKDTSTITHSLTGHTITSVVTKAPSIQLSSWNLTTGVKTLQDFEWIQISGVIDTTPITTATSSTITVNLPASFETRDGTPLHATLVYVNGDSTFSIIGTVAIFFDGPTPYTTTEIKLQVHNLDSSSKKFRILVSAWVKAV